MAFLLASLVSLLLLLSACASPYDSLTGLLYQLAFNEFPKAVEAHMIRSDEERTRRWRAYQRISGQRWQCRARARDAEWQRIIAPAQALLDGRPDWQGLKRTDAELDAALEADRAACDATYEREHALLLAKEGIPFP